ncbi:GNAT family N-acetyltransferase [Nocardia sp. NPDC127526]|uniref:GNAT family N-acetyltransferase n=1 Tax=Nocardia sp. NPDC127526 TaxID=3345393 RepID=UPI0036342760
MLRALEDSDSSVLYEWFQQEWFRTLVGYRYPSSRRMWAQWVTSNEQISFGGAVLMICSIDDMRPIGLGTLRNQNPEDRAAEFSIALGDVGQHHHGLGTEAGVLLGRFGFEVMGLRRMYSWVLTQNIAAIAACEAIGAVREGIARKARLVNGIPADVALYALLAEEFAELFGSAAHQTI